MILGPLSFVVGKRSALFAKSKVGLFGPLTLVTPASKSPWLWMYLKWSFLLAPTWMVELGTSELPFQINGASRELTPKVGNITWALFESGARQRLLAIQIGTVVSSSEAFFRNARWLEREAGEMTGVFFRGKRDKRTLFGLPVFYSNPLRKAFPVGGVFDLGLCPITHKLVFRHVSWLS